MIKERADAVVEIVNEVFKPEVKIHQGYIKPGVYKAFEDQIIYSKNKNRIVINNNTINILPAIIDLPDSVVIIVKKETFTYDYYTEEKIPSDRIQIIWTKK